MSDHDPRGISHDQTLEHPLVRALLDDTAEPVSSELRLDVDPRDEMFRVARDLAHGNRDQALVDYFRAGRGAARLLGRLVGSFQAARDRRDGPPLRVLDFASGWGRVTRFLRAALPDVELTVSDISPDAVEFQRRLLGVRGFVSAARPEDLEVPEEVPPEEGFDVVLAGSLFTHLPDRTFDAWLRRLFELVAPGGVLAVSTHPEERMPEGFSMPISGLFYESASEIPELDVAEYGRTWVTPERMERAIRAVTGEAPEEGATHGRFRRCLWHLQDLWVIPRRDGALDPQALDLNALDLDGGPDGRLEGISFEKGSPGKGGLEGVDKLWLAGWAAHPLHRDPRVRVEIAVAGETVAQVHPDRPRPDVAERFGRKELADSGWLVHVALDGSPVLTDPVLIKVVDSRGLEEVLHLSTFEGLVAWQEAKRLREELTDCQRELKSADGHLKVAAVEVRDLKLRVAAMEASRFWKLRSWWFRIRGKEG